MLEIERILSTSLNYKLYDIDRTDMESILLFVQHLGGPNSAGTRLTPCDKAGL